MKRMILLSTLVGLLFAACSPTWVEYADEDAYADFSQYHTYNFYETSLDNQTAALEPQMENLDKIKAAISDEMDSRGFLKSSNPDLKINLGIVLKDEVQTRETDIRDAPMYIGQRNYTWQAGEVVVREYQEGTLTVDMVDADDNQLIWKGAAAGTITKNQKKMEGRIKDAVNRLFEKFPVKG